MLHIRACGLGEGGGTGRGLSSHIHISVPSSPTQGLGPELFVCQFDLELLISMSNIAGFH